MEIPAHNLELLLSSVSDFVFELTPDGVIINLWTSSPERLFFPPEEMRGKHLSALFNRELSARFTDIIWKSYVDKTTCRMEYESPFESHKGNWYQLQVKPVTGMKERVIAIISEVTQQHKIREQMEELDMQWKFAQEKIKIDEQKFNQAFRYSGIGMALVDLQGQFLDVNKTLSQILGYTAREFKRMRFHDCTHPEDLSSDLMKLEQLNRREIDSYSMEKRYLHKNGNFVWCLLTVTVVYSTDESPAFYISQIQDTSVQKSQLEQLARQKEALEATTSELSMKLEKLEEFNYIVAHNLRGPASNIRSLISLITNAESDSERTEYLDMLRRSSDGLTETFRELADVLEASSNMPLTYERCNFQELTAKVLKQFTADIAAKSIVIKQNFSAEEVHYPRIYLESIIYNLLSNAIKYSAPETVPEIELKTESLGADILLTVSDNGIGIDMDRYGSQLFQFRKTFHRGFDSRGIGLFLIRHQIERAGGNITADSAPGKGTRFMVKLTPHY